MEMVKLVLRRLSVFSSLDNKAVFSILENNLQDLEDFAVSVAKIL